MTIMKRMRLRERLTKRKKTLFSSSSFRKGTEQPPRASYSAVRKCLVRFEAAAEAAPPGMDSFCRSRLSWAAVG